MSLRARAAADNTRIIESSNGFGWHVVLTSPDGISISLVGLTNDISQKIDPETGMMVVGRKASVTLSSATLSASGVGIPRGESDSSRKPWSVRFADIRGVEQLFKVSQVIPDRTFGNVVCMLESYKTV